MYGAEAIVHLLSPVHKHAALFLHQKTTLLISHSQPNGPSYYVNIHTRAKQWTFPAEGAVFCGS